MSVKDRAKMFILGQSKVYLVEVKQNGRSPAISVPGKKASEVKSRRSEIHLYFYITMRPTN